MFPGWGLGQFDCPFAFSNGLFAFSSPEGTFVSADGSTWTHSSMSSFSRLIATDDGFLGLGQEVAKSANSAVWQTLMTGSGSLGYRAQCAANLNGSLLVAGDAGFLYASKDGANFEQVVPPTDYSHSQIAFGNGAFIRYGAKPGAFLSINGLQWESVPAVPALRALVAGNGVWVGLQSNGQIAVSSNARNWDSIAAPLPVGNRVHFANGLFIAETGNGSLLVSADGRAWRAAQINGAQFAFVLGNLNGRWAAMLDGQRPATSENGEQWTIHPSQPALRGRVFTVGNGRFLGLGGGGMGPGFATWSNDGITWQSQGLSTGTTYEETSLTFGGGNFLVTDSAGNIFQSVDGVSWSGERQAFQRFTSAAFGAASAACPMCRPRTKPACPS